jgi:hypothetical protein
VAFELSADFEGNVSFQVISQLLHELVAGNHCPILFAWLAK